MSTDRDELLTALHLSDTDLPDPDMLTGKVTWHDGWKHPEECDLCADFAWVIADYREEIPGEPLMPYGQNALEHGPDLTEPELVEHRAWWCLHHARHQVTDTLTGLPMRDGFPMELEVCGVAVLYEIGKAAA
jgi:hypothetical protein